MKKKIKQEKGITMIELTLTIIVMMILTVTITLGIDSTLELKQYNAVKADIIALTEAVQTYYLQNEEIPVLKDKGNVVINIPDYDKKPNDSDVYYEIDTSLLTNVTIQNKSKTYIVNMQSLTVYCTEGIEFNGQIHYTVIDNINGTMYAGDYYSDVNLPIISVVKCESNNKKDKYTATTGDTVTLKILANYDITPTVTINGENVEVNWSTDRRIGTARYTVGNIGTEGSLLPFSISNYSANGKTGEEITKPTFSNGIVLHKDTITPTLRVGEEATKNSTITGGYFLANNPVIPEGYIAINTETAKWDAKGGAQYNNGLVISDAATNGNEWVWIPVEDPSSLYETASSPIAITGGSGKTYVTGVSTSKYSKSGIISGTTRGLPNSTSYREPDVVVGSNGTTYDAVESYRATAGFTKIVNGTTTTMNISEMAKTMVDEYIEMIESIKKYGGFYIGRYELSNAGVKKNQVTLVESRWYTLYGKCKELAKNDNVKTRMIWGCQWDVTCNWIANNGDKKSITNSRNWGNYADATSPANTGNYKGGTKRNTGSNEEWKANNIYDFAGNCYEWTQEANGTNNRANRGGYYLDNGSNSPAIVRSYDYDTTYRDSSGLRFSSYFNSETII